MREGSRSLGRVTGRTQTLIKAKQGPSTVGRMELGWGWLRNRQLCPGS